jgi:hypothetical protein
MSSNLQPPMPSKDAFQRLVEGVQTLIREHLALARSELEDDVQAMGKDLLAGAAGLPSLLAGYLLLMIAGGFLLSLRLPQWAAFGIVALVNLGAGGAVTWFGLRKMRAKRVWLKGTGEELRRGKVWPTQLEEGTRPEPRPVPLAPPARLPSADHPLIEEEAWQRRPPAIPPPSAQASNGRARRSSSR